MAVTVHTTYKNWQPVRHSVIKNSTLASTIHEKGYAVIPFLDEKALLLIKNLYASEHKLKNEDGAMFYGLYSKDIAYRRRVHESIASIVKPFLDQQFTAYKNVVNTYITKISGPKSEFSVHQDTTALDEFKFSPLSVWIPLQDITPQNGALAVIEKTHWFFSPYRSISFPFPFARITNTLKKYLVPVYLKAGEALVFDPRIVHNSLPNTSGTDRVVALCGVFPEQAELITCFKEKNPGSPIEFLKHSDSYLLNNTNFYYDCFARPLHATVIGTETQDFPEMDSATFEELCGINTISGPGIVEQLAPLNSNFIAEPNGINHHEPVLTHQNQTVSVWKRLKSVFS